MLLGHAGPSSVSVLGLYRSYVREVRKLPHDYLRLFFRIKASDDVRAVLSTAADTVRRRKFRRVEKEVHKLQAANNGNSKAWAHILDVATGRKGKLRWELMEPLLTDPNTPPPPRIIDAVESSRPPVYSPELTALVTSDHSRSPKAVKPQNLKHPHTLPERANPNSDEARLLGRLSKRREVNIRWRFFKTAWDKVLPPLQVTAVEKSEKGQHLRSSTSRDELDRQGVRAIGLQGTSVMQDIIHFAGPVYPPPMLTKKQRRALVDCGLERPTPLPESPLPRFVRRMYGALLSRIPVLQHVRRVKDNQPLPGKPGYEVSLGDNAIEGAARHHRTRLPEVDDVDLAWIATSRRLRL